MPTIGQRIRLAGIGTVALCLTCGSPPATAQQKIVFVTPTGAGSHDGTGWTNAGALLDLPTLILPGVRVWLRADLGPYRISRSVELYSGGRADAPVSIEGVDGRGNPQDAVLLGRRAEPFNPRANPGLEVFRLGTGADHLRFRNLSFRNVGHCFRIFGDVADLEISRTRARNVRRFLEDMHGGRNTSATLTGLVLRDIQIRGFSKDAVRLQYDTHDVLLEDVLGDSERQDGDNFAEGVTIDGTAHDIVLRRVTMRNAHDSANAFWNGDGFATEKNAYRIRFEDTVATGSTDAGYDIKSSETVLVRANASDNAVNFKLWGRAITLQGCVGLAPLLRGGTGQQKQVEVLPDATVAMSDCRLADSDTATTVLWVGERASLSVSGTMITRHAGSTATAVVPTGSLHIDPDRKEAR